MTIGPLLAAFQQRLTGNAGNRRGAIVIGGAVVEINPEGQPFAKAGTVQYLDDLAATFGTVHFFALAVKKKELVYRRRLGEHIAFYPLTHVDKQGLERLRPLLHDVRRICGVGRRVEAALEFFPSAGGLMGSSLLRAVSTRYGVYFGTDPFIDMRSITTLVGALRQLIKRLASRLASRVADFVLVRDPRQFRKLESRLLGRVFLSAPISALPRPTVIRPSRCRDQEVTLLYVGMFSQRKGIIDLFNVLRLLARDPRRQYRLLLVGAPEMLGPDQYSLAQLQDQCRSFGIEHLVECRGYLDDMQSLRTAYESADIFVLASRREGFPRVVEEALLYGLPVVAFELGSLSEVLRNEVHAMLVPPGDLEGFVRAVQRVAEDPVLRETLAASGRGFIQSRFPLSASRQHAALMACSPPNG